MVALAACSNDDIYEQKYNEMTRNCQMFYINILDDIKPKKSVDDVVAYCDCFGFSYTRTVIRLNKNDISRAKRMDAFKGFFGEYMDTESIDDYTDEYINRELAIHMTRNECGTMTKPMTPEQRKKWEKYK